MTWDFALDVVVFCLTNLLSTENVVKDLRPGKMYGYPYMDIWSGISRNLLSFSKNVTFQKMLPGGFKHFLFSPRNLGKMNPFWRAYFSKGLKPPTSGCFMVEKFRPFFSRWVARLVLKDVIRSTLLENTKKAPANQMVGRHISFWACLLAGAMFVSGRV